MGVDWICPSNDIDSAVAPVSGGSPAVAKGKFPAQPHSRRAWGLIPCDVTDRANGRGLAYQAWLMADAILRTLVRMFITKRNMLEWVTAAQAKHAADLEVLGIFRQMSGGILLALGAFAILVVRWPHGASVGLPFVVLWAVAPIFALRISQPPRLTDIEPLSRRGSAKPAFHRPSDMALF